MLRNHLFDNWKHFPFQGDCHENQTSSETDNHADETLFENKTSTNTETHDNWHGKAIYNLHWQWGVNNDADVDHVREQVSACQCLDYRATINSSDVKLRKYSQTKNLTWFDLGILSKSKMITSIDCKGVVIAMSIKNYGLANIIITWGCLWSTRGW